MSDTIVSPRALTISFESCAGVLVFGGRNNISLGAQDGRPFAVFARICERRTPAEVKALMPPPETVETALQRVKRSVCSLILEVSDTPSIVHNVALSDKFPELCPHVERIIIQSSTLT